MKTGRGVEIKIYSLFNLGAGWRCVVNVTRRARYPRERDPVPIVEEAGWATGPVRRGVENLAPSGLDYRTSKSVRSRYNFKTNLCVYN